ncbi:unnamed protein product [Brachionus calyciflorus]|uniref:Reverse transcriptase domain-containing protein n=1 Tax=Brachionus calyciflorus TaxID=104777 RepID=A0A813R592_9BILA|nr:unnamed protein product [Brachionus calyciflorus]
MKYLILLEFMDKVTNYLDKGYLIDIIYTDFSKAFDKVSHVKLLAKLKSYGIIGETYEWIKSFLLGRKQRVVLGDVMSNWEPVSSGVPQGSVLGPILFIIFINDLLEMLQFTTLSYADDLKLIGIMSKNTLGTESLQNDLNVLVDWCKEWSTELNLSKCKSMYIGKNREKKEYRITSHLGETTVLSETTCEKDLGVIITNDLKWNKQCVSASARANRDLGQIKSSFTYLSKETIIPLYTALVRPHLEYAVSSWSPHTKSNIKILERVQKRATKLVKTIREKPYEQRLK